jgi:hypothetical protein
MPSHSDPADCSFLYSLAASIFVVLWYAAQSVVSHLRIVR